MWQFLVMVLKFLIWTWVTGCTWVSVCGDMWNLIDRFRYALVVSMSSDRFGDQKKNCRGRDEIFLLVKWLNIKDILLVFFKTGDKQKHFEYHHKFSNYEILPNNFKYTLILFNLKANITKCFRKKFDFCNPL